MARNLLPIVFMILASQTVFGLFVLQNQGGGRVVVGLSKTINVTLSDMSLYNVSFSDTLKLNATEILLTSDAAALTSHVFRIDTSNKSLNLSSAANLTLGGFTPDDSLLIYHDGALTGTISANSTGYIHTSLSSSGKYWFSSGTTSTTLPGGGGGGGTIPSEMVLTIDLFNVSCFQDGFTAYFSAENTGEKSGTVDVNYSLLDADGNTLVYDTENLSMSSRCECCLTECPHKITLEADNLCASATTFLLTLYDADDHARLAHTQHPVKPTNVFQYILKEHGAAGLILPFIIILLLLRH